MTIRMIGAGVAVLLGIALTACDGKAASDKDSGADAAVTNPDSGIDENWLPVTWPDTMADPVAAGQRTFDLLEGRWELDLSSWPWDTPCEALDCPGPADGWDPSLVNEGDYNVLAYSAIVRPPTRLWRLFDTGKTTEEVSSHLGIGYGEVATFYRRAADGALLVARDSTAPGLDGPDDFWMLWFEDLGDRIQLVVADPFTDVPPLRIEVRADDLLVNNDGFAFRAPRVADTVLDETLPPEYADLRASPSAARAAELAQLALDQLDASLGVMAEILLLLGHADAAVRLVAAQYVLTSYDWFWNHTSRVILLDRLTARLLSDPDPVVRTTIAEGIRLMWTTVPDRYYHCSLHWALTECVAGETDPTIVAKCQEVLDLQREPYGYCPWLTGDWD